MQTFNGKISLSRQNRADGEDVMHLLVMDDDSRIAVLELKLTMEDFAYLITGSENISTSGSRVTINPNVGKKKITEPRKMWYTGPDIYDRAFMEEWLVNNYKEPGWEVNPYLGSQGSIRRASDGNKYLYFSVYKYESV